MGKRIEPVKVVVASEGIVFIRQEIYGNKDSIVALAPTQIDELISELKKAGAELKDFKKVKV